MKYRRFIDAVGGWDALQAVLRACEAIARKHGVSIANVATRWVLEQPAVAAVIVGARLGESEHRDDNLKLFSFALDADDHATLDAAFAATRRIPGDCGDEYRKPPFLTASGDLSHHLDALPPLWPATGGAAAARPSARRQRQRVGADRRLLARRARRRPHRGVGHHRHARQRAPRRRAATRRRRRSTSLDKIAASLEVARRQPGRRDPHARLPAPTSTTGARSARCTAACSATCGRPTRCCRWPA